MKNKVAFIYFSVVIFFTSVIAYALITNNTYDLMFRSRFYLAYENMWINLIKGSIEIDGEFWVGERYFVNGKTLTYYLPFPAIVRGFLSIFGLGSSSVLSVFLAIVLYFISSFLLFMDVTKEFASKSISSDQYKKNVIYFYPLVGIPIIGLCFEASMVWESLLWGLSIFLLTLHFFYKFVTLRTAQHGVIFIFLSSLVLFTRPTFIVGSLGMFCIALFIIFTDKKRSVALLSACFFFVGSCFLLGSYNSKKWGSPLTFAPMQYHEQLVGNDRGRKVEKLPSVSFLRLPDAFDYYLLPTLRPLKSGYFGFIGVDRHIFNLKFENFDYVEPKYTIQIMLPILSLLAILGVISYKRFAASKSLKEITPISLLYLAAGIPFFFILLAHSMALRYRGDMFPLLIVLGSGGIGGLFYSGKEWKMFIASLFLCLITFIFVAQSVIVERYIIVYRDCSGITPNFLCYFVKDKEKLN